MLLIDANVLVYAHRSDAPYHAEISPWLDELINGDQAFALSDHILSSFIRTVTHPGVFVQPSTQEEAFEFLEQLKSRSNCFLITTGKRHWRLFLDLCRQVNARGNLVADAYLAAMAIESGCELVTTDRDYSRFDKLGWIHPLDKSQ